MKPRTISESILLGTATALAADGHEFAADIQAIATDRAPIMPASAEGAGAEWMFHVELPDFRIQEILRRLEMMMQTHGTDPRWGSVTVLELVSAWRSLAASCK